MTLEDLRVFAAACEAKSLTAAAVRLGCTQPAVAQHVRKLEQELETELLSRETRGVVPTASGRALYDGVVAALESLERARENVDLATARAQQTLALAATAMATTGFLRPTILKLRKRNPELRVHLEAANTVKERLEALRNRKADLAFVPLSDPIESFETRQGFETPLRLLVPIEHPLARRKRARVRQLAGLRYISLGEDTATYRHVHRALAREGVTLETLIRVTDPTVATLMVELGLGETIVPEAQVASAERSGLARSLPVEGLPALPMGWAARRFARLPKAAHEFLDLFGQSQQRTRRRVAQHS